jgi:uncharacterized membrane protein YeaQ/YmgE (transglycosylase-associated protein family)
MMILYIIIIGAAAGFLATRVMKLEADVLTTVGIGILGAIIGGLVLRFLMTVFGMFAGFLGAFLGAIFLIWAWRAIRGRR